jgi:glycosyltransferase involved in cell wall biosynthesis
MIVLHLHKVMGVGGSERHLLTLLPALRARGVDARFLGLDVPGTDAPRLYAELDRLGVPYSLVRCGADVDPRLAIAVTRAVRRERPDLLHSHLVHADVYGTLASIATRTPIVSSRHNDDRYLLGAFRYVDRTFARRARRLIAISDAVRRFLERAGLPSGKLVTIRYGLDELPAAPSEVMPAEAGVPARAPLVLAVGRLTQQKDHATLLRAFARAHERHPSACLAILGIGPREAATRALAHDLGLDGAVVLPGRLEIRDWLARADVFVHTSRWEGFGMVLLEAMLASLPVVATRVSAVPEVVADGETGLLCEPGDDEGVARALTALLDDPQRARALGEAGLARARTEFSVERMAERTLAVYESALARRVSRAPAPAPSDARRPSA